MEKTGSLREGLSFFLHKGAYLETEAAFRACPVFSLELAPACRTSGPCRTLIKYHFNLLLEVMTVKRRRFFKIFSEYILRLKGDILLHSQLKNLRITTPFIAT